jgi:hypothetical protein
VIALQERLNRREIFQSIRLSVQELHSDKVILEDANGAPFLFKSKDAQIWVRIFYRSMRDFSKEELQQEIKKLWVLMPNSATLYLFYPELDRHRILEMNGFSDRLSFFEYGGLFTATGEKASARICKWVPSPAYVLTPFVKEDASSAFSSPKSFLWNARLTPEEIRGLAELSRFLRKI